MFRDITATGDGSQSLEARLGLLSSLRESNIESTARIDRLLLERMTQLDSAVSAVDEEQGKLRELIASLTAPPFFPAVFLGSKCMNGVDCAIVQSGEERRLVQPDSELELSGLVPGDEVFLTHERNCVIAKSEGLGSLAGEIAAYSRSLPDGRLVLRARDEDFVVLAGAALRNADLKAGDGVRFHRAAGLAFEKIERSQGDEYFLESTPSETFAEIGGLDPEIAQLKQMMTLHAFHAQTASKYRLRPKKSVLMEGPPGNGKTLVARAAANFLAGLSHSGRSRFLNFRPGQLNSMWYGRTEERYREAFRVAREAATTEPDIPVVMFWDEVDAIGSNRGESANRIDDRMLNCFMAELNGLEDRGNIVILAATNRLDALDPALLRPGRLGDLVLHFPQPRAKAARAILERHLPGDIPYASNGEGPAAARNALLDLAVAQLFAQNTDTELARLTLRDGKQHLVRAGDLVSGAHLQFIAQAAIERACVREAEGGPEGLNTADIDAAVFNFFITAPCALTPRNARNYLRNLRQDIDVVRIDPIQRKVNHPHRYRMEVA
jgi:proteasome-associated ATPase